MEAIHIIAVLVVILAVIKYLQVGKAVARNIVIRHQTDAFANDRTKLIKNEDYKAVVLTIAVFWIIIVPYLYIKNRKG